MSKLKGLLLTQGMHRNDQPSRGLGKSSKYIDFIHYKVETNNIWKIVPPRFSPISQSVL